MTRRRRPLAVRLLVSHMAVVAAGAVTMAIVAAVVTREVYGRRLGRTGAAGRGRSVSSADETQFRDILDDSLVLALAAGVAAALVVGLVAALWMSRRIARPVADMADAAARLTAGELGARVPVPAGAELARLAETMNDLGRHLGSVEQRRTALLAEVSHELRTPLTVIRGRMERLLDGDVVPEPETWAAVIDEVSRMQRLVDDLVLLSRAEEGRLDLRAEPIDLAALAATAADRLRPQFDDAEVGLTVSGASAAVVIGDSDRVVQILSNVLGNALGHSHGGGTVTVTTSVEGDRAVVRIVDTGDGLEPDDLERVFERFYRGTASKRRAGRGLGLTIARSLARAQGGDVSATSPGPGRGATFAIHLPLAR